MNRDLALLARKLHCAVERQVREEVRLATRLGLTGAAVAELERATRARLQERANAALEVAEMEMRG